LKLLKIKEMKSFYQFIILTLFCTFSFAQENKQGEFIFQVECEVKTTPVKNQGNSGTCWAFATVSFIESELLKSGKGEFDLSEMYFVRNAYIQKVDNYIRLQGSSEIRTGGQAHDVMNIIKNKGIMLEEFYPGKVSLIKAHDHQELDEVISSNAKILLKNVKKDNSKGLILLSTILDLYLGQVPEKFNFNNNVFSPIEFLKFLEFDPDDYVELTSFNIYPFHSMIDLQVPDNWSHGHYYNIPIDEMIALIDLALKKGFSVCWDGDVSNDGFLFSKGVAELDSNFVEITDDVRQKAFNDFSTTDDHLMHIVGIAYNQYGQKYYKVKNSWGKTGKYNGYCYMSEDYFSLFTIAVMINRAALPDKIYKQN